MYLPPYPTGLGTIVSTGPDPTVSLPSALQVGADGSLTVPVNIDNPLPAANDGMTEATLALSYDPAVFSVSASDIHLGSVPAAPAAPANAWPVTVADTSLPVLPQLTVSVVAGPEAPVSAAVAVEALGPVSSVGVASRASASAGAAGG